MTPDPLSAIGLAAVAYAEEGWFVVPLHGINGTGTCTCRRHGHCTHAGKHPFGRLAPHGAKDASRRPEIVGRWFSIFPWMNVGIVPGPSGLVVVDEDPRNYQAEAAPDALALIDGLPETLTAATGGGGRHFYFAEPDRRAGTRLLAPGLELKAGRSLLVAPPSGHKSGGSYGWQEPDQPIALAAPTLGRQSLLLQFVIALLHESSARARRPAGAFPRATPSSAHGGQ